MKTTTKCPSPQLQAMLDAIRKYLIEQSTKEAAAQKPA
jgi:hypothetical protein